MSKGLKRAVVSQGCAGKNLAGQVQTAETLRSPARVGGGVEMGENAVLTCERSLVTEHGPLCHMRGLKQTRAP